MLRSGFTLTCIIACTEAIRCMTDHDDLIIICLCSVVWLSSYGQSCNWELTVTVCHCLSSSSAPSIIVDEAEKLSLLLSLPCFWGIINKSISVTSLLLKPQVFIFLLCYCCRCRGHSLPSLRQLRRSCPMKRHHVDSGHLSVLDTLGHKNKQQDIVSRLCATRHL